MYVSSDAQNQQLAREANKILAKDGLDFEILPMPVFEDLYGKDGDDVLVPMGKVSEDKACIVVHSSGAWLALF